VRLAEPAAEPRGRACHAASAVAAVVRRPSSSARDMPPIVAHEGEIEVARCSASLSILLACA
jgi:hypothetical protein